MSSPQDSAPQSSDGLRNLAAMVGSFHLKVLPTMLRRTSMISTRFAKYDFNRVLEIISPACISEQSATLITNAVLDCLEFRGAEMAALRATAVYMLDDDENVWPVVEWIEIGGAAQLAIFHFDELFELKEASWLMHSGWSSDGDRWQHSRVDWNVADVEHLKILFRVVRHMLGVLEWSVEDAMKLYCQIPSDDNSDKECILQKC